MHFAHLKNAPEHVLPDSGSVSVLLQDAEHCSKRVFNSYSYFYAQKTHQKNRIRHEPAETKTKHDRKPVPNAFFGRRKMHVECAQMHVG